MKLDCTDFFCGIGGSSTGLVAGDPESARAIWRSKDWTGPDRKRAERLLRAATDVRLEVLP